MKRATVALLAAVLTGCQQEPSPKPNVKKTNVKVSVEYPNVAGGGIPGDAWIHLLNETGGDITVLPDFEQNTATDGIAFIVKNIDGKAIKQVYPLIGGPPLRPKPSDHLTIKHSGTGKIGYRPGVVVKAYDLQPYTLYSVELHLTIKGVDDPVILVSPFGYSKADKK